LKKVLSVLMAISFVFSMLIGVQPSLTASAADIQQTYYVSPSATGGGTGTIDSPFTLSEAQTAVRAIDTAMTGDIYVYLRGGTYYLEDELDFTTADSGTNGHTVYYAAYQGETPVISGGQQVTGWSEDEDTGAPVSGLWKASLTRSSKLRAIYVNGKRAEMTSKTATSKGGTGTYAVTKDSDDWAWISGSKYAGVLFNAADLPLTLKNPKNIELLTKTTWNTATVCVDSISASDSDSTKNVANLQMPYGAIAQEVGWAPFQTSASTTIYNVYEWLTTPGQFYFDQDADALLLSPYR
jgi:hypothetical protein